MRDSLDGQPYLLVELQASGRLRLKKELECGLGSTTEELAQ